eukprot:TRINITY_DN21539_c0_g1_i4.p1 TRINITY_DN21539_c0_g1~~TRINITY_DN21539_c0_g1_i4.p1  ORF type:complete len:319 (-),score=46.89 TRINITY_DN21539_c0_g1_i4:180-1004(-)
MPEIFICEVCNQSFDQKRKLTLHMKIHKEGGGESLFKCSKCPHAAKNMNRLKQHYKKVHEKNPETFSCKICNLSFDRKRGLSCHMKIHQEASNNEESVVFGEPSENQDQDDDSENDDYNINQYLDFSCRELQSPEAADHEINDNSSPNPAEEIFKKEPFEDNENAPALTLDSWVITKNKSQTNSTDLSINYNVIMKTRDEIKQEIKQEVEEPEMFDPLMIMNSSQNDARTTTENLQPQNTNEKSSNFSESVDQGIKQEVIEEEETLPQDNNVLL